MYHDQIQDGEIIINEIIMQIDQAKMLMSGDYEELADAEVGGSEFVLTKELSIAGKERKSTKIRLAKDLYIDIFFERNFNEENFIIIYMSIKLLCY